MDKELRELKNNIIAVLNNSMLIMEAKRLILSEILHDVEKAADENIRQQIAEQAEKPAPAETEEV